MKKHWKDSDFVMTSRSDERQPDGSGYYAEAGYCRVCKADMARFGFGSFLRHYNSHEVAKRQGINWKTA